MFCFILWWSRRDLDICIGCGHGIIINSVPFGGWVLCQPYKHRSGLGVTMVLSSTVYHSGVGVVSALQTPFTAFDVQYSNDPHAGVADHDVMKFDVINTNVGHAYNPQNGMFQVGFTKQCCQRCKWNDKLITWNEVEVQGNQERDVSGFKPLFKEEHAEIEGKQRSKKVD